jgi:hypothetical protein
LPSTQETKVIKTFYEYGKIEHIFYIVDGKIVRIRAFSYDGLESEVPEQNLNKWYYDPILDNCYIDKADS